MKIATTFFLQCCAIALFPLGVWGQTLYSTAGAHQEGIGFSISWSLGEPITLTALATSGDTIALTQGFQQPLVAPVREPEPEEVLCENSPPKIINDGITSTPGIHDFFKFEIGQFFQVEKLVIVNRWGELIREYKNEYNNDFDGTAANGSELPQGTYYYLLVYGNEYQTCESKGSIHVLR